MKIDKKDLITALEAVKPGLHSKEITEQATAFAFINDRVVTYNDNISLSHPVKDLELEGAVQAKELYDILQRIKKDEIELELEETQILIKSGRTRAGLTLHDEITMPLEEIGDIEKWKKCPEDFVHFLKFAMATCKADAARPILEGVHVRKDGWLESSDNQRVTLCELGEKMPVDTFIIPAQSSREVVKLKPSHIYLGEGWVHFKNKDKTQLSCRILEDEYPSVKKFFDFEGLTVEFPDAMTEVIDRAIVFSLQEDGQKDEMEISLSENKLTVKTQNDSGWFKESSKIKYSEEPFSFLIAPHLLQHILKESNSCVVGEKMLQFEGAGWKYVSVLKAT